LPSTRESALFNIRRRNSAGSAIGRSPSKVSSVLLVDDFATQEPSMAFRQLAAFYDKARDENENQLTPLRRKLRLAVAVAGVTVLAFLALVWLVAS
jgi:hypothetical protein